MWTLIAKILEKWALLKVLRGLGGLAWLIPIALVLKAIGLPLLILLAILAVPILIVLAVLGLPLILIAVVGGSMLMILGWIVSLGAIALKIALPLILVYWMIKWFVAPRHPRDPFDVSEPPAHE
jgi:hypothetical protein